MRTRGPCNTGGFGRWTCRHRRLIALLLAAGTLVAGSAPAAEPIAFPIKISANRRYFVDQAGRPVFWLGTTQWQLFREYRLAEVRTILDKTSAHGFAFVQVMLAGVGDGTQPNVDGQKPWHHDDPLTPNEAYFTNVDAVVRLACDNHLAISLTLYHQRYRQHITPQNARVWAQWLAARYKEAPNIVWSMTPEARQEFVPVLRELAAGLRAGDGGRHLVTFKPDPAPYSSGFIHDEPWLDFDSMQTWNAVRLIYPMVTKDYHRLPVKPVLMAEGAYEAGSEYGFEVTPLWVRRQAYYSYLAGGHHTYGHNDSWRVLPTWPRALDAPGAQQMGILKRIFLARREWWLLVPDQAVLAAGGGTDGDVLRLAARHAQGQWALVYLAARSTFTVRLDKIAAPRVSLAWINPGTGATTPLGVADSTGPRTFTTPAGWDDALLILEAAAPDH